MEEPKYGCNSNCKKEKRNILLNKVFEKARSKSPQRVWDILDEY